MPSQEYATKHNDLDVLIVGAGFSGWQPPWGHLVLELLSGRPGGLGVLLVPLSTEEVWKDWAWSERFPGRDELMAYFEHVDKKLDLSRDINFDTRVTGATFDASTERWIVSTQNGRTARPRFLVLCTGYAAKPFFPDYPGLSSFQGAIYHTARWPQKGVELAGKRVGVIGTGASGVQVIQETAPIAGHLTVFQRTPNMALPMNQRKVTETEQVQLKEELYPIIFRRRTQTFTGVQSSPIGTPLLEMTPEEQHLMLEDLWVHRTFWALLAFPEVLSNERTNALVYNFWRDKVRKRITDPRMREKLAPETAPHPFGVKRSSLEQRYFEAFNQPNVTLVDLHETPILAITPTGVKTEDGMEHTFDVLVLATGFDALSGSISQINIRGTDNTPIGEIWGNKGVGTYLGLTCAGYPNMFFPYGPQAPTAFCGNPACLEFQCDWVVDCLMYMRTHKYTRIEATPEAEAAWVARIEEIASTGLWYRAKSWYFGANVPGKRVAALNFMGGLALYIQLCRECVEDGYAGFVLSGGVRSHL
ncbi:hypothetical protein H0H81_004404 [Sphagnurus paluster]|uniref:FAD/NAD(P)-binding domain-containing protein n=1 Tax=Sphagnurus paluster TaxID=117069 RepID=A0A9P7K451_9AGAR|nr:hypothetical protein H0H81_004404 [Sphagnurus paluster]